MLRTVPHIGAVLLVILPVTNALTLSNFQPLPDELEVPVTCTIAYRETIPNCVNADFLNGAACSSGCITGLNFVSLGVNTGCPGVIAQSNTLLGKIFQGQLISLLCPNTGTPTAAAATSQRTTVTVPAPTAPAPPVESSKENSQTETKTTAPTPAPILISTSISIFTRTTKSSADGGLGDGTSTSSSTEETSAPTGGIGAVPPSSTSAFAKPTSAPKKGESSTQAQQAQALQNTGGGSLFDIQLGSGAIHSHSNAPFLSTLLGILCIGIYLGR